jgi:hypothetical protein
MTNATVTRRAYLGGIAGISILTVSGCASPYGYGELDTVAETIAEDLTHNTPYEYRADENGNEDPGNEVYVGWSEGGLNVSVDAEFAESVFCNEAYGKKELQQDPERMEKEKNDAFDSLLKENPHLSEVYFYAFRDTMRDLEPKENTSYYAFRVDFSNGSIWNEYEKENARQLYESLEGSEDPIEAASKQFRDNGRFDCSAPENMPTPPE